MRSAVLRARVWMAWRDVPEGWSSARDATVGARRGSSSSMRSGGGGGARGETSAVVMEASCRVW